MSQLVVSLVAIYFVVFLLPLRTVSDRAVTVLFSIDCTMFSICTRGESYPGESFSSAAHRGNKLGKAYGRAEKWIDAGFSLLGQSGHCKWAYDQAKYNLPEDMR